MKKELKREFRKQEAEVVAIQIRETTKTEQALAAGLQRKKTIGVSSDRISHAFRLPN
jgi:hypothetical protein